jgi:hypothetical protein
MTIMMQGIINIIFGEFRQKIATEMSFNVPTREEAAMTPEKRFWEIHFCSFYLFDLF